MVAAAWPSSQPRGTAAAAAAPVPVPVGLPTVPVVLKHGPHLGVEEAVGKGDYEALQREQTRRNSLMYLVDGKKHE